MLEIKIDVNLHADSALAVFLDNFIDCWSSDIVVRAGGVPTHGQTEQPAATVDVAQEFGATPVPAAKEREINELNVAADTQPSTPAAKADEKLTESELVEIRAKAQAFMKGDAANKDKVKAWLNKNGLTRVTEMPKSAVTSFLALIGGGNG